MKNQRTFIYFINSLVFLCLCVFANAQKDTASKKADSLKIKEKYGLRIGTDIGKIAQSYFDDDYNAFEISADFRIKKNLYIASEIGFEEKTLVTNYLDVISKGNYLKGGIDINMYENWLNMDNMIYSGFRIGTSLFNHDLNSFNIYNTNQYWAPQFSSSETKKFDNLKAIWTEVLLGMKAELLNNLYLGINLQLKVLINKTSPENFEVIYIPGYGKTYDSGRIGVGYSYTISYRIPLFKK